MSSSAKPSLRERRRADLSMEISELAADHFRSRGVSGTTVADLAQAAGISTRTFHRHFPTKADALAPVLREGLQEYLAAVSDIPARRHPFPDLTAALVEALANRFEGPTGTRDAERTRLVVGQPELLSVWLRIYEECVQGLIPLLSDRLPVPMDALRLRFQATLVVTANRLAVEEWAVQGGSVRDHLGRCLGLLTDPSGTDCQAG